MSKQGVVARDSLENLKKALASGQLSQAEAQTAQDLKARLQKPLRLSVFGMPGSGKSTLLNLLLGKNLFSDAHRLPTISLVYGEKAQANFTLPSGTIKTIDTDDLGEIALRKPAFVELALPLPALRKLSMLEVVVSNDIEDQQRAVRWAAKRTDIALWCTQECSPEEEALWSLLPEHMQDHAFLVVTGVDMLGAQGRITDVMKDAQSIGPHYFRDVLPIATTAALAARRDDGTVDKAAMRSSGGIALISAILREVETGQRAAADAADVFLGKLKLEAEASKPDTAEPDAQKQPNLAVVEQAPEPAAVETPKAPQGVEINDVEESQVEEPEVAQTPAEPEKEAEPVGMTPAARALCRQLVDQLTAEGAALAQNLAAGDLAPEAVVEVSVDTVTWMADYLGDNKAAQGPAMAHTCETANDAADLVQLIQLEKGDNVALDALSLMIQLKHEIQAELAA